MIKDRIKTIIILIFTIIIGVIIYYMSLGYIINLTNLTTTKVFSQNKITLSPFGPITNTERVNQYFKAEHNNLSSLGVDIGTYNKKLLGVSCFTIRNITKNVTFYNKCLLNTTFVNDKYYTLNFPIQKEIKGNNILLSITSPTKSSKKAIALFTYNTSLISGYKLYVNHKLQNQNIAFTQIYKINNNLVIDGLSNLGQRVPYNPILKGTTLKQYFITNHSNLNSIQIAIGNYDRINNSLFCIKLKNITQNNIFYNKCIISTNFINNQNYTVQFPEQKNIKNNKILISIFSPNATANNAVTVFMYNNYLPGYQLYLNNTRLNYNIDFTQEYNLNYGFLKSINIIYHNLDSQNPYIIKGYYIYIFLFIYPIVFTILIFLLESYLLKDKSIKNIILTNIVLLLIFWMIIYYNNNLQDLIIGCYNSQCVGTTISSGF